MSTYSNKGHYYIPNVRREVVQLIKRLPAHSNVLDVGAGYGNNAKALLEAGFTVTALETNADCKSALTNLAALHDGKLKYIGRSITDHVSDSTYDAVICCMTLHFIDNERKGFEVIDNIKNMTKTGGYNLITQYLDSNILDNEYSWLLKSGQLSELYSDWDTIMYKQSYARTSRTLNNIKDITYLLRGHKGYKSARIIARKPI